MDEILDEILKIVRDEWPQRMQLQINKQFFLDQMRCELKKLAHKNRSVRR